ncbi:glutamate--tRNA ligase [Ketogulonicigenium vulgare]|uniref:Glutamate--tRNA ligase n=1 Tax=Ketogulonicigenium vulgare (strain WSH-001) TaxID=759362 RepID=F9Y9Y2_KETVW|nr:glutamate--tRNA ligase [Ketogulonicigenium vulgare]ADO42015.1 glutamyl-tRNA synthetase [Ketogulonicigenium vulgare Y25]AEM40234.1 Glutamyl-tRNA synthetase, putative [Ketogulonicigenium vulgare WSH-001]ALJ80436.1 glutamine--tRNA ligase [Ketogulonicigenium vulgare]ANW33264.1 glutamate--tRNA ligase [Ketogulonicigenium vulgare]AOZ53940.1 glutamyl-tRNA synthetase [Ketogulonicigenium vulgare]
MTTTRFAPSPTGWIHIGNLRAALFNYAIARQQGGKFILRIDDTDLERSKQEYIDGIKADLTWLGLTWDQLESQSARFDRYTAARDQLIAEGRIYECFETPVELDLKRKKQLNMGKPPVYDRAALLLTAEEKDALRAERGSHWRFKLDHQRIEWEDGILGAISIDAASVSDPVIIKNDGQWLYTFASVVDDIDMGVTNIVRGSDHVTNTATQIQMIEALGGTVPRFAHHSLLTGPQGEGLSKRLGALSLRDLRAKGLEPMAVLSLMARLGSSEPVEMRGSIDEIVANFKVESFGASPTKFDENDLWPLTAKVLAAMSLDQVAADVAAAGVPDAVAPQFWAIIRENIATRADIAPWWQVFAAGDKGSVADEDKDFIREALAILPAAPYAADSWSNWLNDVKAQSGRKGKGLFMPLRKALTGAEHGPEMADILPLFQVKPAPQGL